MFNSKVPYVTRASRQQEQRRQKKHGQPNYNYSRLISTRLSFLYSFFILDVIETKFGLSSAELATVWEPMLESIKSKRRNIKAKIRKSVIKPSTLFF
jgi:hypothetical protein